MRCLPHGVHGAPSRGEHPDAPHCTNTTDICETIETAKIGRWSSFVISDVIALACVPVLLLSSDGNVPVFCLCLEL